MRWRSGTACRVSAPHRIAVTARNLFAPPAVNDVPQRTDQPKTTSSRPRQPNYLTRLRDLVFGQ